MGPLQGIRVVEFAGKGPGPVCGMMFADLGAEVVLIERASASGNSGAVEADATSKHAIYNRGKKILKVDLKAPGSRDMVLDLIHKSDALIEGFRPGVMERLGFGPDTCCELNPRLVYTRITGWGQSGPLANAAGHEPNYLSITGALHYSGLNGTEPFSPGSYLGDMGGGAVMAAWGTVSAILHAQKTGKGQVIDAAITDGVAYLSTLVRSMCASGMIPEERGATFLDGGAYWNNTYRCADGKYITVCALEPNFHQVLIEKLGLPADEFSLANQWNFDCWPLLKEKMAATFLQKTRDEWSEILEGTDACFGPVLDYSEATHHPHNLARETFVEIDGVIHPAPAPRFSLTRPTITGVCDESNSD